jgi:hypothetical protein
MDLTEKGCKRQGQNGGSCQACEIHIQLGLKLFDALEDLLEIANPFIRHGIKLR